MIKNYFFSKHCLHTSTFRSKFGQAVSTIHTTACSHSTFKHCNGSERPRPKQVILHWIHHFFRPTLHSSKALWKSYVFERFWSQFLLHQRQFHPKHGNTRINSSYGSPLDKTWCSPSGNNIGEGKTQKASISRIKEWPDFFLQSWYSEQTGIGVNLVFTSTRYLCLYAFSASGTFTYLSLCEFENFDKNV